MSQGVYYDTAQICLNSHVVNARSSTQHQHNQKFCEKCGEAVLYKCDHCHVPIRGQYSEDIGISYTAPSYCFNCGKAFSWSIRRLAAAKELADEFDELSVEEKELLKQSIDDLMKDIPQTKVAETRLNRLIKKAGNDAYEGMRGIIVDVVSEAVKKSVFSA